MVYIHSLLDFLLRVSVICPLVVAPTNIGAALPARVAQSKYTKAHSLEDNYNFDPRDGWESINVTDLHYKYRRNPLFDSTNSTTSQLAAKRSTKKPSKAGFALSETIGGIISGVFKGLKAIGNPQTVTITWYIF